METRIRRCGSLVSVLMGACASIALGQAPTLQYPAPPVAQEFEDGQIEGRVGLDDRPYAAPTDSETKWRKPWNLRPISWHWRLDNMTFRDYQAQTAEGPFKASLGPRSGLGFGASLEAFPFQGGAWSLFWDYRLGFSGALSLTGPRDFSVSSVSVDAEHQVAMGVDLGWKAFRSSEWHVGLEQRAERYKATGPEPGAVSSAWVYRPWLRAGIRWHLNMIRDLRPFLGLDIAVPLKNYEVPNQAYLTDLQVLLGTYPWTPVGTQVPRSSDSLVKAHTGKFQVGLTYGIKVFRPKRAWRPADSRVGVVPSKPGKPSDYVLPPEAFQPEPGKPADKKAPEPKAPEKPKTDKSQKKDG